MLSTHSPECYNPDDFLKALTSEERANRDLKMIERAAKFAFKAHGEQKRKSGEPYITHPFAVAILVDELKLDTNSICSALLHDVIEDCSVKSDTLKKEFNTTVAEMVDGVTKLSKLKFNTKAELQAESLRKMLLAMTKDVRVILIKLCDRLHNMRTLDHMVPEKQARISHETLDIYCPLAHRLGMSNLKWQLEDLCLKYTEPEAYYDILKRIAQKRKEREVFINAVIEELRVVISENGFKADISGRPKSFYSIFLKSRRNEKYMDEMYDLIGIRIITESKANCYAILGLAHSIWTPLQHRFKDYIAVPKPNLYQSLHTTVIHPEGQMVEVQIRTQTMHETSENGVAAHFLYKETDKTKSNDNKQPVEELKWLKQIVQWHTDVRDSQEFIENLKLDLFQNMVYAFTPNGKVIELREGSTPIDFAYYIHTEVGNKCVGAKVDDRVVPLNYRLKNGDIVRIVTSKNSKGPSRDWLETINTRRAREGILAFLRKSAKEDYIAKGSGMILQALEDRIKKLPAEKKVSPREITNSEEFQKVLGAYGFRDITFMQEAIGKGEFKLDNLVRHLEIFKEEPKVQTGLEELSSKVKKQSKNSKRDTVFVAGSQDMLVKMSKCCSPLYGDEIIGFITRGRGVTIHRGDCPNAINLLEKESERAVDVQWDPNSLFSKETSFLTQIQITAKHKPTVIHQITTVLTNFKVNICNMSAKTKNGMGVLDLTIEIGNVGQLNNLIKTIGDLEDVTSIYRLEPGSKKSKPKTKKR